MTRVSVVLFGAILVALHLLGPGVPPLVQGISHDANGPVSWLLPAATGILGIGALALMFGLLLTPHPRRQDGGSGMRAGVSDLVRRHPLGTFFVLAFAITWSVWVPRAAAAQGLLAADWAVAVGQVWTHGPALAALIAAALTGGRPALRDLGARLVRWRVGWRWYAVVLAGPLAISLAAAAVWMAFGGTWTAAAPEALAGGPGGGPVPLPQLALFFVLLALTDGLGEETGWRGYALPRLLAGHSALAASLGLGVVWTLWHLPLFWTAGAALEGRSFPLQLLSLPALSILYTWIFRHTRGSLLLAVLFHAAGNLWGVALLPPAGADATPALLRIGVTWLLALGVTVADRTRAGPALPASTIWATAPSSC